MDLLGFWDLTVKVNFGDTWEYHYLICSAEAN